VIKLFNRAAGGLSVAWVDFHIIELCRGTTKRSGFGFVVTRAGFFGDGMAEFQAAFALRLAPVRVRFGTPAAAAVAKELASLGQKRADDLVLQRASAGEAARP
jgi:hypothetical protein